VLAIIKLAQYLPKNSLNRAIEYKLINSATSVGANYISACRAKIPADFAYKIGVVE
jgi:four helix bundle protein